MKHFTKFAVMCICLIITALFTSACGGSKATPPTYPYFPISNQQENNQQQEEEQVATTEFTLTLTDSLQADKIAFADIYYSVDSTAKSSADDQEILKATPNAEDKTKFTVSVNGNLDTANLKVKAILTYDNEENLLDYFSSYDGVEATNGIFNVDFENSKDNEQGFGGGTGTKDDPF